MVYISGCHGISRDGSGYVGPGTVYPRMSQVAIFRDVVGYPGIG